MSGNPEVKNYRKWLSNLFNILYEEFDWAVCHKSMKEHNEELAHQKIVSDLRDREMENDQKKTAEDSEQK